MPIIAQAREIAGRTTITAARPAQRLQVEAETYRGASAEDVVDGRVRLTRLSSEAAECGDDRRLFIEQIRYAAVDLPMAAIGHILAKSYSRIRV